MGYHVVDPAAVDRTPDRPCDRRAVSDAVGFEAVALNLYIVDPGQQAPLAYHFHESQEELFFVADGPAYFETPEHEYRVKTGNVFAVEPGNPHRLHNPDSADDPIQVLAIGAPRVDDAHRYEP